MGHYDDVRYDHDVEAGNEKKPAIKPWCQEWHREAEDIRKVKAIGEVQAGMHEKQQSYRQKTADWVHSKVTTEQAPETEQE